MSEEEEDYMSDTFLTGCVQNDIRPGLIKSHAEKRNFIALKRKQQQDEINKKKNPNLRVLECEKRKEGLEKPIENNSKGFAMLQKMGYKPGSGIGKTETGRTEPIPINLKSDREGLGREQQRKEIIKKKMNDLRKNAVSVDEYRVRMTEKVVQKQNESDFRKSQKICEYLDNEENVFEPGEKWYWQSTDPEIEKERKLETKRRKLTHDSESDLDDDVEDSHSESDESEDSLEDDEIKLDVTQKLNIITSYLRNQYCYCIWCSVKYNDADDLNNECPGGSREVH